MRNERFFCIPVFGHPLSLSIRCKNSFKASRGRKNFKKNQARPVLAVLDVFAEEPLPEDSPLWSHPKVSVTAHISNAGHGFVGRSDELFLSNLERFIAGEEPLDVVSAVALANPE